MRKATTTTGCTLAERSDGLYLEVMAAPGLMQRRKLGVSFDEAAQVLCSSWEIERANAKLLKEK